jgi:glycosyltransferase involved in cell wall biosynthesis
MTQCRLSIVVPAFNEERDLPSLLRSLEPLIGDPSVEVLVVDNGSRDATAQVAGSFGARAVSIERISVGAARNVGARAASGRVLAFLDADVVVSESWARAMLALAGDEQWEGEITGDVCDVSPTPSWLERHWFRAIYQSGGRNYLNSGNLAMARGDFVAAGGFDERLVTGEDSDLCLRSVARGIRLVPRRELHVHHMGYPRTLREFMRREAWHGRGDFTSLQAIGASPVAVATFIFIALHAVALVGALSGKLWIAAGAVGAIAALCVACSFRKFWKAPLSSRAVNAVVYYFYFAGRARSAWDVATSAA